MNSVVRRRFAVGAVSLSTALVVGLVVAPSASAGTVFKVDPGTVFNTNAAQTLVFTTESSFVTGTFTLTRQGSSTDSISGDIQATGPDLKKPSTSEPVNLSLIHI